jgi:hypothetical protein
MLDFDAQQEAIKNRMRRYGSQGYEAPQGQMVGRHFVAPNALQQLAAGLRGYGAIKGTAQAEQELKDLTGKRNQAMTETTAAYVNALRGKAATEAPKEMFVADDGGGGEMTMGTQVTPAVAPDPLKAFEIAMQSPDANMRQMGTTQFSQYQQNQAAQQQKIADQQAADAKVQAQKDQQTQLWEASGGDPQKFLAAGGDFEFAKTVVDGQGLGAPKVARVVETFDPKTGRPVQQQLDVNGNPVGAPIPVYVPPKAPSVAPAPKDPKIVNTDNGPMAYVDGRLVPIEGAPTPPKQSASSNISYIASRFLGDDKTPGVLSATPQGGWFGVSGAMGSGTQSAKEFDNLREQLSTELRTMFRIPGEGALSDKEQAQYGIQLPERGNSEALNRKILNDVVIRANSRIGNSPRIPAPANNVNPSVQNLLDKYR